jgi:uncharacterized protein with NRDE domain
MCTVIVLRDVVPGLPLVIAANRDVLFARPTEGARWEGATVVSGVDGISGGTWMGATTGGLVVAVTNHRTGRMPDLTKKSRGAVVRDALAAGSREGVRALVDALEPAAYNGFNLFWGDATGAEIAYVRPDAPIEITAVAAGVTVLANDRVGTADVRAERAFELATGVVGVAWPRIATELGAVLAERPICIHTERYGTRSATIAAVGVGGAAGLAHYLVSVDAPCRSPLVDAGRLPLAPAPGP